MCSFELLEIIQVLDSTAWVRCASGNVSFFAPTLILNKFVWKNTFHLRRHINSISVPTGKRNDFSVLLLASRNGMGWGVVDEDVIREVDEE